jgi:hypothetical protein
MIHDGWSGVEACTVQQGGACTVLEEEACPPVQIDLHASVVHRVGAGTMQEGRVLKHDPVGGPGAIQEGEKGLLPIEVEFYASVVLGWEHAQYRRGQCLSTIRGGQARYRRERERAHPSRSISMHR